MRSAPNLPRGGSRFRFEYDFGDSWSHDVVVEQITAKHDGREPLCFDGERACPPQDVGGTTGFEEFLVAIADPEHERTTARGRARSAPTSRGGPSDSRGPSPGVQFA